MTSTTRPRLRAVLLILGVLVLVLSARSSVEAQSTASPGGCGTTVPDTSCAWIFVKPSFVVKNLHPLVIKVSVWCSTKIGEPNTMVTVESFAESVSNRVLGRRFPGGDFLLTAPGGVSETAVATAAFAVFTPAHRECPGVLAQPGRPAPGLRP